MLNYKYTLNEVLNMGYYEVYRLWTILDESLAKKLQHLMTALDNPHCSGERRSQTWEWLQERQPRAQLLHTMPKEVMDKLEELFGG